MQLGWVKIGDFRPISRCVSETVKDRDVVAIVTTKGLLNGAIFNDLD